jgi:hypothetical protein
MTTAQRLKGQEVSVKIIQAGLVIDSIDSISAFNESIALELKEQGYLGETVNRFDEILNGYGGDFEFHVNKASWHQLTLAIISRATREQPDLVFNVVRTDFYPNGDSVISTYQDVKWGPIPTSIASRGDYVKPRMEFRCEERPIKVNGIA